MEFGKLLMMAILIASLADYGGGQDASGEDPDMQATVDDDEFDIAENMDETPQPELSSRHEVSENDTSEHVSPRTPIPINEVDEQGTMEPNMRSYHKYLLLDSCSPNTCHNEGACIPVSSRFKCDCMIGYTGRQCDVRICEPNKCKNDGECVPAADGSFTCSCKPGFSGEFCNITSSRTSSVQGQSNPCNPNPCPPGTRCQVIRGLQGYLCYPITPCASSPCKNGGTCINRVGSFSCKCPVGFQGIDCSFQIPNVGVISPNSCIPNPCLNGATCNVDQYRGSYNCVCLPQFHGNNCEIQVRVAKGGNPCIPNPCSAGRRCQVSGSLALCIPIVPRSNPCIPNPCSAGRRCQVRGSRPLCIPIVSLQNPCIPNPCSPGGRCQVSGSQPLCIPIVPPTNPCIPNPCREGRRCQVSGSVAVCLTLPNPCIPNPCSIGKRCQVSGSAAVCLPITPSNPCIPNPCSTGKRCQVSGSVAVCLPITPSNPCIPNPCSIGKRCQVSGSAAVCLPVTSPHPCIPNPCSAGERCQVSGSKHVCIPVVQRSNPCIPNPCSAGGRCQVSGSKHVCIPIVLQSNPCIPNPCSEGARCQVSGSQALCIPIASQSHPIVPQSNPCIPNPCSAGERCQVSGSQASCIPIVPQSNPCIPNPCSAGERCQVRGSTASCLPITHPCIPNPCPSGHLCQVAGSVVDCTCPPGWRGPRCTLPDTQLTSRPSAVEAVCFPNPCLNGCQCSPSCRHSLGYYCKGDNAFLGKNCSIAAPTVRCEENRITVSVSAAIIQEYNSGVTAGFSIYASPNHSPLGNSCTAQLDGGFYTLQIGLPFSACGTTSVSQSSGKTEVANTIWLNRILSNIADMPVPLVRFLCIYGNQYSILTSLNPVVGLNLPSIRSVGSNRMSATIELCKSGSICPARCPVEFSLNRGAVYTIGEVIHVSFRSVSGNIRLDQLFLACTNLVTTTYTTAPVVLVKDGCLATAFGKYLPTTVRAFGQAICTSFQVPKLDQCNEFFIHAKLDLCQSALCNAPYTCSVGRRRRRSLSSDEEFRVYGPIIVINGGKGQANMKRIVIPDIEDGNKTAVELLGSSLDDGNSTSTGFHLNLTLGIIILILTVMFVALLVHNRNAINAQCGRKF